MFRCFAQLICGQSYRHFTLVNYEHKMFIRLAIVVIRRIGKCRDKVTNATTSSPYLSMRIDFKSESAFSTSCQRLWFEKKFTVSKNHTKQLKAKWWGPFPYKNMFVIYGFSVVYYGIIQFYGRNMAVNYGSNLRSR